MRFCISPPAVVLPLLAALLLPQCGSGGSDNYCHPNEAICIGYSDHVLVCREDGSDWDVVPCPDDTICYLGLCEDMDCAPESTECRDGGVVTCAGDGAGWGEPVACEPGFECRDGECREVTCTPGAYRCDEAGDVERCDSSGTTWDHYLDCADGTTCFDGVCLPEPCEPGQTECGPTTAYECDESGSWVGTPCPEGQPCIFGRCVECVGDDSCAEGEVCEDGLCIETAPEITTDTLPYGSVDVAYSVELAAEGGVTPYTWSVSDGDLPPGLDLEPATGLISGAPTEAGIDTITVMVTDSNSQTATREFDLEVLSGSEVQITTRSLPNADHGFDYSTTLEATGGIPPYAWQLLDGALPAGLSLSSTGEIAGTPTEFGDFHVTFRVIDIDTPPGYDTEEFDLTVEISPIEILGDTEYDLFLVKIILLPTLIPFVPYATDLRARGGVPPYSWTEEAMPGGLSWLFTDPGLPAELSLSGEGHLSGWVTDVSGAQRISIPFGPELAGYFFYGRVADDQTPADTAEAIFCVPTIAL